ncbi:putative methyltransferase C9orf114 homolog isoform X2 [Selaginella moellendorffii]|uniref:putative methyltransferase C9orf114 homolog isoform X2 n=1 Tax=Selaginella moellendorffii TaxID=88036 RepID=UPI000D1CA2C8|nr:putative methyltransferase C9orf114 homolog isoform X2 [Selaginella moellendorffii]|eukprot:XP_024537640.1 putative methyltransferase C9orf114 homolog isoform X2 [Selaginella moellendorffii]
MGKRKHGDADSSQALDSGSSGRKYTVSLAVSGSIINNAQSLELATRLAGQIARAATIFRIDEIVVFDDGESSASSFQRTGWGRETGEASGGEFLARVLRYLEVPQYLRRALVPMHKSLRYAGQLPPLDSPHHLRKQAWLPFREGVALDKSFEKSRGNGCYADVGLGQDVLIQETVNAGTRITVAMGSTDKNLKRGKKLSVVPSSTPRESAGLYWGYTVRVVDRLTKAFSDSSFEEGYDYTIGTSEHGEKVLTSDLRVPSFRHALIVFGGPAGLEESLELDGSSAVEDVRELFTRYLNTCPLQGSRTIRTEEAIFISLQFLQEPLLRAVNL